jgi:DNA-binding transcriptional regulator YiaG
MNGQEIKAIRAKFGVTQVVFAAKLGVSPITVARWEVDRMKPSPLAVGRIKELAAKINKPQKR